MQLVSSLFAGYLLKLRYCTNTSGRFDIPQNRIDKALNAANYSPDVR